MAFNTRGAIGGGLGGAASGAAIGSIVPGIGTAIGAGVGGLLGLLGGSEKQKPPQIQQQSLLRPEQEPLYRQLVNSGLRPGAGGAFGQAADYHRSNLSDNPADFNAFAAPELRRYNQETIPGLSEQFAGFGSGGLGSSGFRNAQIQGATDLSERLGALRAQLRQNSAQGLQNIGQIGLGSFNENVYQQQQPGFASGLGGGLGQGIGAALPSLLSGGFGQNSFGGNNVGANTNPYQGGGGASSPPVRSFGALGSGSLLNTPRLGR